MGTGPVGSVFRENSFSRENWGTKRVVSPYDPRVSYSGQTSGTGPSASCVYIVAPFAPLGPVTRENWFYRAPGRKWAHEPCGGCPQHRYVTGEPGKLQGRDRMRIVEKSCGYRAHEVSIRGNSFYRESWRTI